MQSVYLHSKTHSFYLTSHYILSTKYNTTPIQYSIHKINTLLYHNKVHYTSLFKEHLIYTDIEDYVYLYYPLYKSITIIKHIHSLYQHQIPSKHFPSENIRKIMLRHFHASQRQHKSHLEHNYDVNQNKVMKYSYIFPLNIQKDNNETNTNYISSTSENTIYSSNTNNDISYTLDLNINTKYDYKAINKNTDFINSSISVLNNIITDINGKKVNAKTIHKRNKNNFLSHLSTIKTKLQKQTPKLNKQLHLNLNETNLKPKTKSNQCYTIRNRTNINNNNITNSNTLRVNTTNNITNGTIYQSQSNLQVNLTCTSTPIKKRVSSLINGNNIYSFDINLLINISNSSDLLIFNINISLSLIESISLKLLTIS